MSTTTTRQPAGCSITRALESAICGHLESSGRPAEISWLVRQFTPGFTASEVRRTIAELAAAELLRVYADRKLGRVLVTLGEEWK